MALKSRGGLSQFEAWGPLWQVGPSLGQILDLPLFMSTEGHLSASGSPVYRGPVYGGPPVYRVPSLYIGLPDNRGPAAYRADL